MCQLYLIEGFWDHAPPIIISQAFEMVSDVHVIRYGWRQLLLHFLLGISTTV